MKSVQSWQYQSAVNLFRLSCVNVYILDFEQGLIGGEYGPILYTMPVLNLKLSKLITNYGIQYERIDQKMLKV